MRFTNNFSKSSILLYLKKKISDKNLVILEQISFSKKKYYSNKSSILNKVKKKFPNQKIIIRSSAYKEDKASTLAGKYNSFLDIDNNPKELDFFINKCFETLNHSKDKIFVQKFIKNADYAGVLFTEPVNISSPYYVVNCDHSKKTNLVTSGSFNPTMELHNIYKNSNTYPKKFKNLILIVKKIEKVFPNDVLDIEFAKIGSKIIIFQCRSLRKIKTTNNFDLKLEIEGIGKKINKLFLKNPTLIGKTSILSNMADWNPAEMIGSKSSKFSSTLYKELITDEIWAIQRFNYGYKDVRPNPLMINVGDYNYIDIRTDLNSFLPRELSDSISEKLINFFLKRLKKKNFLHDKIEFKLIPTCYQSKLEIYLKKILSKNEIKNYKKTLANLTSRIVNQKYEVIKKELNLINKLKFETNKILFSNLSEIQKIFFLIDICKKYGTLPFAGLARCGFISKKIFDNLVEDKILSKERSEKFFSSISTIVNEITNDLYKLKKKKISKKIFLNKYGHLRPSSYSISSLAYKENFNFFFKIKSIKKFQTKNILFKFTPLEINQINFWLKKNNLNFNSSELIKFSKISIYHREKAKYEFTKTIDKLFQIIISFCKKLKIKRSDIEYLDLNVLLNALSILNHKELRLLINDNIKLNKKENLTTNKILLPDLILSEKDSYFHSIKNMKGNYITNKIVVGSIFYLKKDLKDFNINNKIVLIENADPGYDYIFNYKISGLITMYGGPNSHMSIRCNELNIPAVIGIGNRKFELLKLRNQIELNCQKKITKIIA